MGIDGQGMLWLTEPWTAAAFCSAVLALFLVVHHRVSAARPAVPRTMAVRERRPRRPRRGATVQAPRPSLTRAVVFPESDAEARPSGGRPVEARRRAHPIRTRATAAEPRVAPTPAPSRRIAA